MAVTLYSGEIISKKYLLHNDRNALFSHMLDLKHTFNIPKPL